MTKEGSVADKTRRRLLAALPTLAAGTARSEPRAAAAAPTAKTRHVGRSFVFDYGEMVIRVRYVSASR